MKHFPTRIEVSPELQDLVERHCAGTLTESENTELQRQLSGNAEARSFFIAYLAVHSGLQWKLRRGIVDLPKKSLPIASDRPTARGSLRFWKGQTVLAAALVSAAAVGFVLLAIRPAPEAGMTIPSSVSVGRLAKLQSRVMIQRDGVSLAASVGMQLLANDSLQVPGDGLAFLTLSNASRVELGPRSVLAFEHEGRPALREGFAQIDATGLPSRSAWSLRTPEADAEVRGSRFSVGAGPLQTMLRVAEGTVSVSRRRDGSKVDVAEGYCSTIAADFDLQPLPSRYGTALLIVSREKRYPEWNKFNRLIGNRLIGDRLWRLALSVEVRTFDELEPADIKDRPFVVVSLFDFDKGAEERLRRSGLPDSDVPVLCLEPAGFPVFGMTGPKNMVDYGTVTSQACVEIIRPEHPLAGGFAGTGLELSHRNADRAVGWARPSTGADKIARLDSGPEDWMLFGFEKGAALREGVAPARRVGLFLDPWGIKEGSPGLKLIDAAIQWCVEDQTVEVAMSTFLDEYAGSIDRHSGS